MIIEVPGVVAIAQVEIAVESGRVAPGQPLAYCRDVSGGAAWVLSAQRHCVVRWDSDDRQLTGRRGQKLGRVVDEEMPVDSITMGLWMSSHAAFRSLQALDGQGGQVAVSAKPVHAGVREGDGLAVFVEALKGTKIRAGDVVVLADKPVAIAQGRVIPKRFLKGCDPKFLSFEKREQLAREIEDAFGLPATARHMLMLDHVDEERASVGGYDHNRVCAELAGRIREAWDAEVDVVIADSDTGVDLGEPLIGIPTVGATPLGATAGLTVYEAMRVSALAEMCRGHTRHIPIVVVQPSERNRIRNQTGKPRPYAGMLHITLEPEFHRGFPTTVFWEVDANGTA